MRSLSYFVVGLLLLSGFASIVMGNDADEQLEIMSISFLEPEIIERETFIELEIEGANACLYHVGKPILPVYTTSLIFSFGTKIVDIECEIGEVKNMVLSDKIAPTPKPMIQGNSKDIQVVEMDQTIYNSDEFFPNNWYEYSTGGGLDENNEHKTFFNLKVYPVRYNPLMNIISFIEDIDLKITYKEPETSPFPENSEYDLVIIAPSIFSSELQELTNHKNSFGMNTILKTTEDIYGEYSGVDKPEQIKYFIKDALDTWNIKYVLLVGGMKSFLWGTPRDDANQGTKDWHLPVRYSNHLDSGDVADPGFICDLYYADIYDSEGNFSSWDPNGDGIFARWKEGSVMGRDVLDLYPDVCVGRLACRNNYEVEIMVDKIINYEKEPADGSWFNRMVLVGGDTSDDSPMNRNYYEGELICDTVLERYMTDFTAEKLYASNKDSDPQHTPIPENFQREVSTGCGHLLFDGHAKPNSWSTHWPHDSGGGWTPGIRLKHFPNLKNGYKLPVCVIGGCHSSQINVTLFATLLKKPKMWTYGEPAPECWAWCLTRKINGGAIATIGNTGLGIGWSGQEVDINGDGIAEPACIEGLGPYQQLMFYKTYYEETDILGEAWKGGQTKYLNSGMDDHSDIKTIEEWILLGDPSLKIGGYP